MRACTSCSSRPQHGTWNAHKCVRLPMVLPFFGHASRVHFHICSLYERLDLLSTTLRITHFRTHTHMHLSHMPGCGRSPIYARVKPNDTATIYCARGASATTFSFGPNSRSIYIFIYGQHQHQHHRTAQRIVLCACANCNNAIRGIYGINLKMCKQIREHASQFSSWPKTLAQEFRQRDWSVRARVPFAFQ